MNTTGWQKGLQVTADGTGIVSHAGVALVRALADNTGLTAGLSKALATDRLLVHDRGRVLADLACAIADGAEVISDFRLIADQEDLFGLVASVPTVWRMLDEIARDERALDRITAAVNAARRRAWAQVMARHGTIPGIRIADKTLAGVTCIRLDASVVACHRQGRGRADLQGVRVAGLVLAVGLGAHLYPAAKADPGRRFHALYDKISRSDVLWGAWVADERGPVIRRTARCPVSGGVMRGVGGRAPVHGRSMSGPREGYPGYLGQGSRQMRSTLRWGQARRSRTSRL